MYYYKGKSFNVGELITTITGVFGTIEVTYTQDYNFDQTGMEQYVSAFAVERKLSGNGLSVESAVLALYKSIAEFEAMKDTGTLN